MRKYIEEIRNYMINIKTSSNDLARNNLMELDGYLKALCHANIISFDIRLKISKRAISIYLD